jgi:hypothetical protein
MLFANKVLRTVFGREREEVTGWRMTLHNLYSTKHRQGEDDMAGNEVWMREIRNACRILVGKRPLHRPRRRWEVNIASDL